MALKENIEKLFGIISSRLTPDEAKKFSEAVDGFLEASLLDIEDAGEKIRGLMKTDEERKLFDSIAGEVRDDLSFSAEERKEFENLKTKFDSFKPQNQTQASPKPQLDHRVSEAINTWVNNVGAAKTSDLTILSSIANKGGAISATINYESLIEMVQDDVKSYVLANSTGTYESQVTTLQDLSAKLSSSNGKAFIGSSIREPEARPAAIPQQPPSSKQTASAQSVTAAPVTLTMEQLYPKGIDIKTDLGQNGQAAVMLTSEKNIFQEDSLNNLRALVHISDQYGPKKDLSDKQKGEFAKMMKDAASDGVLSPKDLENIKSKLIEVSEPLSIPNGKGGTAKEAVR